jgi:glycerate dehydrogenase
MQKLTFLDAMTMGQVDLSSLAVFGELKTYDTTSKDETVAHLQDTNIAITNKVVIDAEVISKVPTLKLICVAATGTNCVDLQAASEAGVTVCNVAGYSTASVTQHTLGLMINLATGMHRYANEAGEWSRSPIFTRLDYPIIDLAGKTLGVVGLGTIGKSVAAAAMGLGMDVIALAREGASDGNIKRVPSPAFYAQADFVSLHCPLTPATENIMNSETLGLMKPTAFLVNTGRGQLINEGDLAEALKRSLIAGAGLDVLTEEPPSPTHTLLDPDVPNLIITPHTAWASEESRQKLVAGIASNISAYLAGKPENKVN